MDWDGGGAAAGQPVLDVVACVHQGALSKTHGSKRAACAAKTEMHRRARAGTEELCSERDGSMEMLVYLN